MGTILKFRKSLRINPKSKKIKATNSLHKCLHYMFEHCCINSHISIFFLHFIPISMINVRTICFRHGRERKNKKENLMNIASFIFDNSLYFLFTRCIKKNPSIINAFVQNEFMFANSCILSNTVTQFPLCLCLENFLIFFY